MTARLLYTSPSLRNAGRANLLLKAITATPSLAPLVLSISLPCSTHQDPGHPSSLLALLEHTRPHALELGSTLLAKHGEASRKLLQVLEQRKYELTSWAYGFVGGSTLGVTLPLLQQFARLTSLSLVNVSIGATPATAPPPYQLRAAAFSRIAHLDPATLDWLLGQPARLRVLALDQVSLDCTSSDLHDTLARHIPDLRWLTLREVDCALDSLARVHLYERTWNLNPLLALTPHLVDLTFGDQLASAVVPGPDVVARALEPLRLPPRLKRLELRGRWMYCWLRIGEMLAAAERGYGEEDGDGKREERAGLEDLRLVGPFLSDMPLKRLMGECGRQGIRLEVRRSFSSPA